MQANATNIFYFPGYNVTQAYPARGTLVEGSAWLFDVSVYGNVPIQSRDNTTEIETRTSFRLQADRDLVEGDNQIDESWTFCLKILTSDQLQVTTDSERIDRECRDVISDDCREALGSMAEDGGQCSDGLTLPDECSEDEGLRLYPPAYCASNDL
jgi:hypothetical protein